MQNVVFHFFPFLLFHFWFQFTGSLDLENLFVEMGIEERRLCEMFTNNCVTSEFGYAI